MQTHILHDVAPRAARAMSLILMGEMSAARQALEGTAVPPGTLSTLRALTDPEKRPPLPRTPLSRKVAEAQPSEAFQLDSIEFITCLRKAHGAAADPSGMTSDHLFPVLARLGFVVQGRQFAYCWTGPRLHSSGSPAWTNDSLEQARWRGPRQGATYFGQFRLWPGQSSTLANFYW